MKRLTLIAFALSMFVSVPVWAENKSTKPEGIRCNVADKKVCVIAKTEGDCKKIEGEVVEACPEPEAQKDKTKTWGK